MNQFWPFQANEKKGYGLMDLTYGSHHVGQYWPMLTMSSSYVIFASQIVSALDLGRILASAQVTL